MATTNSVFKTFTITQPWLGADLQFQPARGSQELDELIDTFIPGPASKQDKMSQVTMHFYRYAPTINIVTGARVSSYQVAMPSTSFEQSPTQSNSSGFSPPAFTPSDSGYGTMGTPPVRHRGSRVSKKPRKETKKAAEINIPGFQIMTKDGVDVTSSAGRGTKTDEQRRHAHLMRQLKACDACKRKKVRCDPSHKQQQTGSAMSRNSSSSTSAPSVSRETTHTSQQSTHINALDDFVLFPEDSTSAWAEMSLPEFTDCDLNQFNFDISNDLEFTDVADQSLDFSAYEPSSSLYSTSFHPSYTPALDDHFDLDQWASPISAQQLSQSSMHTFSATQNSMNLSDSWYSSSSSSGGALGDSSGDSSDNSPISPVRFSLNDRSQGPSILPQVVHDDSSANANEQLFGLVDWALYDSDSLETSPVADQNLFAGTENRKEKRSAARQKNKLQQLVRAVPSLKSPGSRPEDSSDLQFSPGVRVKDGFSGKQVDGSQLSLSGVSLDFSGVDTLLSTSIEAFASTPARYQVISTELGQLRQALGKIKSGDSLSGTVLLPQSVASSIREFSSELQELVTTFFQDSPDISSRLHHQRLNRVDPEGRSDHVPQLTLTVRRLIRSLCATINSLHKENAGVSLRKLQPHVSSSSFAPQSVDVPFDKSISVEDRCSTDACYLEEGYDGGESGCTTPQAMSPSTSTFITERLVANHHSTAGGAFSAAANDLLSRRRLISQEPVSFSELNTDAVNQYLHSLDARRIEASPTVDGGKQLSLSPSPSPSIPPRSIPSPAQSTSSDGTICDRSVSSPSFFDDHADHNTPRPVVPSAELHHSLATYVAFNHASLSVPDINLYQPTLTQTPLPATIATSRPASSLPKGGEEYAWGGIPHTGSSSCNSLTANLHDDSQCTTQLRASGFVFVALATIVTYFILQALNTMIPIVSLFLPIVVISILPRDISVVNTPSHFLTSMMEGIEKRHGTGISHHCTIVEQSSPIRWAEFDDLRSFISALSRYSISKQSKNYTSRLTSRLNI